MGTFTYASINCVPLQLDTASGSELVISLPTTDDCTDWEVKIQHRVFGSGSAFAPSTYTIDAGTNTASITGLDECVDYQFLVELLCDGDVVGGCANGQVFSTKCEEPDACDCINFYGIAVVDVRGCDAVLVSNFNAGKCGRIEISSYSWDLGYPGGTANTEVVYPSFPANGSYTIKLSMTFVIADTGEECTVTDEIKIDITDCKDGKQGEGGKGRSYEVDRQMLGNTLEALNASPNPFSDRVELSFELPQEEKVALTVFDTNGKIVYRESLLSVSGKNVHSLDLSGLANGLYFYQVRTAFDTVTGKLTKQ